VTTGVATPAANITVASGSAPAPAALDNANTVVDQNLVKRGYRARKINGELKYCRAEVLTGTHFHNTVCLTREQIGVSDANTKEGLDTLDKAGRASCLPKGSCN
jgi:hypothetical protein